jgi:hypothetical protein
MASLQAISTPCSTGGAEAPIRIVGGLKHQIIIFMLNLEARRQKSREGKIALERVSHRIAALGRCCRQLNCPPPGP